MTEGGQHVLVCLEPRNEVALQAERAQAVVQCYQLAVGLPFDARQFRGEVFGDVDASAVLVAELPLGVSN